MLSWKWMAPVVIALAIMLAVNVSTPKPAEAFIDEIIAAMCNGLAHFVDEDGNPTGVTPPGQIREGNSFVKALQATGFIENFDFSVSGQVTINFDPTVPNSKFREVDGNDLFIPDGFGPGVALILSPNVEPDPDFPAHKNCPKFPAAP